MTDRARVLPIVGLLALRRSVATARLRVVAVTAATHGARRRVRR